MSNLQNEKSFLEEFFSLKFLEGFLCSFPKIAANFTPKMKEIENLIYNILNNIVFYKFFAFL